MWTDQTPIHHSGAKCELIRTLYIIIHHSDAKCELIRTLYIIIRNKRSSKSLPLNTLVMLLSHVQHSNGAKNKTVKWRNGAKNKTVTWRNGAKNKTVKWRNGAKNKTVKWRNGTIRALMTRYVYRLQLNQWDSDQTIVRFTGQHKLSTQTVNTGQHKLSTPVNTNC